MQLGPCAVNHQHPVISLRRIHSLCLAFLNTKPYINNSLSLKEFKHELKKEINSAHVKSTIMSQVQVA